ncbi:MAG: hypothetical protein Q8N21_02435 [bacterium]|nr:hypothetical protein [bacterium]
MSNTLSPDEQIAMAGRLRQEKMEEGGGGQEEEGEAGQPRSLRERVMAARRAMDIKQRAKDKIKEKITEPAKQGTNSALRWAWTTLIPSWGLSLIYINLHVFLKMVFGEKLFCKLGDEWIPKQISQAGGGEAAKTAGTAFGIVEVMGLVLLDLVVLIIILGVLGLFLLMCDIIQNPLSYIGKALGMAWDAITGIGK